jgi:Tol biopolymer transport system component
VVRTLTLAIAMLLAAGPAGAQYFGRNKVQSAHFNFRILETPHFELYYYPEEHEAASEAGRLAERWYARLSAAFDHQFTKRTPIILYASHTHFTQTTVLSDFIPDGVGGFTDHFAGRVVLPMSAGFGDTEHVLGHELVHAFQRDILRRHGQSLSMLPLWFSEGMAEALSVGPLDTNTEMWLRDAVASDKLPTIAQLGDSRWFPYRYGQALWTFLAERYGPDVSRRALLASSKRGTVGRLQSATHVRIDELSSQWQKWIRRIAAPPTPATVPTPASASLVTAAGGGHLNIGPSISPDGRSVVFLSERDGLSVDVYLADAMTGAVRRRLLSTAADPHFDSLEFLDSAGSWSPDGRQFALAAVRDGMAVLTILDIDNGGVTRELPVSGVDQLYSPAWSPDGRQIAFSGMHGGSSDLFTIGVARGKVRALTADGYSDLQPAWSPDGATIVFSTDRFSSSLATLTFGNYRLGLIDMATGAISPIASNADAKNIDPHWTPDGAGVLFVSDRQGISNVYHLDLASGTINPVTDVGTGVSGLTALSPAMSVALQVPRLVYSVYTRGGYELHGLTLDKPAATPLSARIVVPPAANNLVEPPVADAAPFMSRAYVPKMSLAAIGQPYMSAGGGAFGSFLRAGTSFSFGDMLGQQRLETAIQAGTSMMDFAVQAAYENRRSRWTWGAAGGQVPVITGEAEWTAPVTTNGDAASIRTSLESQQIHRQLSGVLAYPFSRAKRVEFTFGFDAVSFAQRTTTTSFASNGRFLDETTSRAPSAPMALIAEAGTALVYDTAVLGPNSPIVGQRYRLSLSQSLGALGYTTMIADYRRYFMPIRTVTVALRAEEVGRFGNDILDPRLTPLVWTVRDIVRGYDDNSTAVWSAQRFAALNGEVRLPIPGVFHGRVEPSALPIEAFTFADWARFSSPRSGLPTKTTNLGSAGAGVRLNAAGLVFEFGAARTLTDVSGPRGWRFVVNFRPGF